MENRQPVGFHPEVSVLAAPKVFNSVADAVEWCIAQEGVSRIFHYLDDFAVVGPPDSPACLHHLLTLKRICATLGIPLAEEKQWGPSTVITLLGIVIDTIKGELRLPEGKLQRLIHTTAGWGRRKSWSWSPLLGCFKGDPARKVFPQTCH